MTNNNYDGIVPISVQNIYLEEAHQQCEVEIQQLTIALKKHKDELTPEMAAELSGLIQRLEAVTVRL